MSTLALWSTDSVSAAIATEPRPSLFERLIKARERQATRQVYSYLNLQSDERLKDLGYTSKDIAALRAGEVRIPR